MKLYFNNMEEKLLVLKTFRGFKSREQYQLFFRINKIHTS